VQFRFESDSTEMTAPLSPPLFDWVIENLLKNALDAMDGNGIVTVHMKEDAGKILIDVTDTGKGITRENIARVFKPGFTTKKRGWGLGLSLSKRIIEKYHNGWLFVKHSEPGKGTTFRIELMK
jgi:signal transduction histidine kinase